MVAQKNLHQPVRGDGGGEWSYLLECWIVPQKNVLTN